jgi:DNA repair protein RadC
MLRLLAMQPVSSGEHWKHPGGKLRELGAQSLDDAELLAILISTGTRGRPAESIAREVLGHFGSLEELAGLPLERLLTFKGLGDVKILRIAAAFEIARRVIAKNAKNRKPKS